MEHDLMSIILKYFDCFGTNFNFYTERNRKFYTPLGGVLTLLSFIFGIIIFIYINIDDFLLKNPNSTTSTIKESYRNIKFRDEKIWIPWRLRDYNSKTVNHTGILFPIIYYYKGIRSESKNSLKLTYEIINYRLCNETSMKNNSNSFLIDLDLEQLFCIDMEDLDMGGSWDNDFINYVEFDLYACKKGIDYDENNENCTSYEKLMETASQDNSFEFEIYYPVVHYQPMNKTTPLFIKYTNYFYHLSRFSNKIDRIYLQQHILNDDKGLIFKNEKSYSVWGYLSLNGDSYSTGDKRDLMNEGSTSRLYSFNIYLKSDVVHYNRSYKKLFLILADGLPIIGVVFTIFRLIAKVFKISSGNKKLTELLFENLQEKKPNKIKGGKINAFILKQKKVNSERKLNKKNNNDNNNSQLQKIYTNHLNNNNNITLTNNNLNDASSLKINSQSEHSKKLANYSNRRKHSIKNIPIHNKSNFYFNLNPQNNNHNKLLNSSQNLNVNLGNSNNNKININIQNNNIGETNVNLKNNESSSYSQIIKSKLRKRNSVGDKSNMSHSNFKTSSKPNYVQKKLFPYKYYLCSIFIKNIDLSKNTIFFTKKFIVVYNFICQLFDISSYLILQKEFQIMKNTIMIGKYGDIIENRTKINVNDRSFNNEIKECLNSQKFSILGRVKQSKTSNY